MSVAEKLLQVGGVIAGLGATLSVGYLIYALEQNVNFWGWLGVLGVGLTGAGLLCLCLGLVVPRDRGQSGSQVQRGGRQSRNFQAGRDISMTPDVLRSDKDS
jgi:hypothetical protein